jgi:hypothetical protein
MACSRSASQGGAWRTADYFRLNFRLNFQFERGLTESPCKYGAIASKESGTRRRKDERGPLRIGPRDTAVKPTLITLPELRHSSRPN